MLERLHRSDPATGRASNIVERLIENESPDHNVALRLGQRVEACPQSLNGEAVHRDFRRVGGELGSHQLKPPLAG